MDMNYNLNNSLNASLNLAANQQTTGMDNPQLTGQAPIASMANWSTSYPNMTTMQMEQLQQQQQQQQLTQFQIQQKQQQLEQINAQIARMTMVDNGTTYLDTFLHQQGVTPTSPVQGGPVFIPPQFQGAPQAGPVGSMPNLSATYTPGIQPLTPPVNGNFQSFSMGSTPGLVPPPAQMAYSNTNAGLSEPMISQNSAAYNVPLSGPTRINVEVPNSLPLHNVQPVPNSQASYSSHSSSPASSSPATPKRSDQRQNHNEVPTFYGSRPRQQHASGTTTPIPPKSGTRISLSDNSSTTSSTSVPGSPVSASHSNHDGNWSDMSGPTSPDYYSDTRVPNGDARSPTTPIQNKPILMQTRYPQDKCYHCMKKVYPMEKLGAVRGVVFHKGCFKCKVCSTTLNLKNFFHNQGDTFDLAVYCKSHQPLAKENGPKIDAESFQIKSALNAPKQGKLIPQSERTPVHQYNYDANAREILHARKVPASDLQAGNKLRNKAWSKSKRERDGYTATGDVVKHDDPIPEYDMESYQRHQVENYPDYGGR